ncbi:hypothetical protein LCGC14_2996620 [marine sediment metagenome]|uniref:Uncharacterized protein n=1 Tax=marine sediment metagenome TaxID=412755 RepID=A0A0F8XPU2_9ZZZZ
MKNRQWLVVSLDVGELGEWLFHTREQALSFRRELIENGAESDNISLYYGKINLSKIK